MNRSLVILMGALALGAAIFAGSFFAARQATRACCTRSADNVDWLRTEFHLSAAELARVRELQAQYQPKCAELCARIAAKRSELDALLGQDPNLTAEAQTKLDEIAALRAQCQTQMLQHFVAVSRAMPPAEGRRYLDQMKQLTLGRHEPFEPAMSDGPAHEQSH